MMMMMMMLKLSLIEDRGQTDRILATPKALNLELRCYFQPQTSYRHDLNTSRVYACISLSV